MQAELVPEDFESSLYKSGISFALQLHTKATCNCHQRLDDTAASAATVCISYSVIQHTSYPALTS